ncbi:MAG: histidine phosphatase family protein [Gammaproteobacteria bacterium]|nr:histidine phosphatase family protein [Gammaproteobacteria bacterium]
MDEALELHLRRRKRRRQRRIVAVVGFMLITIGLAWFFESQATTTIIVTRYADTLVAGGNDPGLSPHGQVRAQELARVLGDVDVVAGIDVIYTVDNQRARKTSEPLARKNNAPVRTMDDPADVEAVVAGILREHKGKIILLITEPELMQPVIAEMQGSKKLPAIQDREFDNLYIVSIPWFGKVKTLRLKFGSRFIPQATSSGADERA